MGRQKTIDRDTLLDLAEDIVRTRGAAALTIDALARAAGVTKGGVQYTFTSKAALIDAIGTRWIAGYEAYFASTIPPDPTPEDRVRAHVGATLLEGEPSQAKAASLMTGMLQSPEFMQTVRQWYRDRSRDLDPSTPEGRQARLAFLATEGAFCLRFLGLMDIGPEEWKAMFTDIEASLPPRSS